jgi:hypothetical protein
MLERFQEGEDLPLINTFYEYLLDGMGGPKIESVTKIGRNGKVPQGRKPGAPLDALLLWAAGGKLGLGIDGAMNFPLPALKWLYATEFEQQGRFRIPTPRTRKVEDALRAYAKEHGLVPIRLNAQQMQQLQATGSVEVDSGETSEGPSAQTPNAEIPNAMDEPPIDYSLKVGGNGPGVNFSTPSGGTK